MVAVGNIVRVKVLQVDAEAQADLAVAETSCGMKSGVSSVNVTAD